MKKMSDISASFRRERAFECQDCGFVLHNYTDVHLCIVCHSYNVIEKDPVWLKEMQDDEKNLPQV